MLYDFNGNSLYISGDITRNLTHNTSLFHVKNSYHYEIITRWFSQNYKYLFGKTNFETTKPETGCHYYDKHSCKLQKLLNSR